MKCVMVSMQRVVQVCSEEKVVVSVPQNVGDDELRGFLETQTTHEPWCSFAEIAVSGDYDGEDWDRLSVGEIVGVKSGAATPEVTIIRNPNGDWAVV